MSNINAKLVKVMDDCSYVQKEGKNKFHGYNYAMAADIIEKVNSSLVKHGISTSVETELVRYDDVTNLKGNVEHIATVSVKVTFTDGEDGSSVVSTALGSGQDAGDKAVYKAQTGAIKYVYMMTFAIATGDDPEGDDGPDKFRDGENPKPATPKPAPKPATTKEEPKAPVDKPAPKPASTSSVIKCSGCSMTITDKVAKFSKDKFGQELCFNCQKNPPVKAEVKIDDEVPF